MNQRPLPTGPYAVGTTTYTVYTDREELRAPGTKRSVPVRVYYPVQPEAVAGMDRAPYMSRNVAEGLKKALHVPIRYDKRAAAGDNVSECYPDAPRIEGRRFPLVVYNHGLSSYRESNSFLCIELASQGYVVMAVGHPYDACCAELDDDTCLFFDGELSKKQYDPFWRGMMKALQLTHTQGTDRELAQRFDELQQHYCKLIISRVHEWELDTLDAVRYARETWGAWIDIDRDMIISYLETLRDGDVEDREFQERMIDAFLIRAYVFDDGRLKLIFNCTKEHREVTISLEDFEGKEGQGEEQQMVRLSSSHLHTTVHRRTTHVYMVKGYFVCDIPAAV